jgi:transcriptional regulator with XRE-family HTH domain
MTERNHIVNYLLNAKFDGSIDTMSHATGYSKAQISKWLNGKTTPSHKTLDALMCCVYVPEFTVVAEFFEIDAHQPLLTQLKKLFSGHEECVGIYAFYDSMANLLYVGKASTSLLKETYSALRRSDELSFPLGIKHREQKRCELVRYISAYDVSAYDLTTNNDHWDYPKHVESLILRISKPPLNRQIGALEKAYSASEV